jgi:hypothetical protein
MSSFILLCSLRELLVIKRNHDSANNRFLNIIEALENDDNEKIKDMFSLNALKAADDIDDGIDYIMNLYKGKLISKKVTYEGSSTDYQGEKTSKLKCIYTVKTEESEYSIFFIDKLVDTKNPDNVGLYMLQIDKVEDKDKEIDWENRLISAGIYRPSDYKGIN